MNYLLDGRCEISNNAAERKAKSYVTGRKIFLFHDTENTLNLLEIFFLVNSFYSLKFTGNSYYK